MKTLTFIFILLLFSIQASIAKEGISLEQEVKEYDQIFSKIATKRLGADITALDKMNNPFIIQISEQPSNGFIAPTPLPDYLLEAIVDQKVKINSKWYRLNETIDSFQIIQITQKSALLSNGIEKKELFIRTTNGSNIEIFSK